MEKQQTLKEIADDLAKVEGKVRGEKFRTHATYIIKREGDDGLVMVEKRMEEVGYPFKFNNIEPLEWYPVGLSPLIMLVAKDLFGWTDEDIFDMGASATKYSFLFKMVVRYVVSIEKVVDKSHVFWYKNYDFGSSETTLYKKDKYIVTKIKGFKVHPVMCHYLTGYIEKSIQYVVPGEAKIEEVKCIHEGDPYEKYITRWD